MQDADEGFPEEEGKSKAEGMAPPLGLPAHFALEGTAEHSIVSSPLPVLKLHQNFLSLPEFTPETCLYLRKQGQLGRAM